MRHIRRKGKKRATFCRARRSRLDLPYHLCDACEEAEMLGAVQIRMFPAVADDKVHLRNSKGEVFCGAARELVKTRLVKRSTAREICESCRGGWHEFRSVELTAQLVA